MRYNQNKLRFRRIFQSMAASFFPAPPVPFGRVFCRPFSSEQYHITFFTVCHRKRGSRKAGF